MPKMSNHTTFKCLIVDDYAIDEVEISNNFDPKGAREENLMMYGPEAINRIYKRRFPILLADKYKLDNKMSTLMFCAPKIVMEIYGYEYGAYRELMANWTKDFGIYYALMPEWMGNVVPHAGWNIDG